MAECEHDWRVDPNFVLASYPPRSIIVCADCGATKYGPWGKVTSQNPKDWEKAE